MEGEVYCVGGESGGGWQGRFVLLHVALRNKVGVLVRVILPSDKRNDGPPA